MRWFKHLSRARRDEKIAALMADCGIEGYGFYFLLCEVIAEALEKGGVPSLTYTLPQWSHALYSHHHRVSKYLGKLRVTGLCEVSEIDGKIRVTIPNLLKYRDEYSEKSRQTPNRVPTDSRPSRARVSEADTEADTEESQNHCASDDAQVHKPPVECSALEDVRKIRQNAWFDSQHNQWHAAFWNRTAKKPSRKAYEKRVKALVSEYAKADKGAKTADLYVKAAAFLASERDAYRARFENADVWDARAKMHPATWLNDERWTDGDTVPVVAIRPAASISRAWDPAKDEEVG